MELEFRHLRMIRAIADAGSVTKAADRLGLAQSALSTQLKRIEAAMGGRLFERGREGVQPTPLGVLVLERSRVLLPAMRQLQEDALRFATAAREDSELRLGATHGPFLGALVDRLVTARPELTVSTQSSTSASELVTRVVDGRLDVALTGRCGHRKSTGDERLEWREITVDPVFALLSEDHPLARERELGLEQLAGERWALPPGEGCFGECFAAACVRAGFLPRTVYEADAASCLHLVRSNRAAALCRATFPPPPGVVVIPLTPAQLSWRQLICWRPRALTRRLADEVLCYARAVHADAVTRNPVYTAWLRQQEDAAAREHGAPPSAAH
ncbi:LysR substrate-binding domain-containing protein [Kitasatospora sp. NPDC053057]|uniref:LysR substrate-binding domain-containing protein n=1 Tax=Kitasatospora sp. NPDC053057 TaxID=3364062 RepID=UPI0037C9D00A